MLYVATQWISAHSCRQIAFITLRVLNKHLLKSVVMIAFGCPTIVPLFSQIEVGFWELQQILLVMQKGKEKNLKFVPLYLQNGRQQFCAAIDRHLSSKFGTIRMNDCSIVNVSKLINFFLVNMLM